MHEYILLIILKIAIEFNCSITFAIYHVNIFKKSDLVYEYVPFIDENQICSSNISKEEN